MLRLEWGRSAVYRPCGILLTVVKDLATVAEQARRLHRRMLGAYLAAASFEFGLAKGRNVSSLPPDSPT